MHRPTSGYTLGLFAMLIGTPIAIRCSSAMAKQTDDQFPEEEPQRRFEMLVKAALNTPPKPMKDRLTKRHESKVPKPRSGSNGRS
jgi:hypothetical protein